MTNNLIKILGIVILLSIPKNTKDCYLAKEDYNLKKEVVLQDKKKSKEKVKEIEDIINSLNIKREFFSERIKEENLPPKTKENYLKSLNNTKKELNLYNHRRDSIYRLLY